MARASARKGGANLVTFETAHRLALALPGTEERAVVRHAVGSA